MVEAVLVIGLAVAVLGVVINGAGHVLARAERSSVVDDVSRIVRAVQRLGGQRGVLGVDVERELAQARLVPRRLIASNGTELVVGGTFPVTILTSQGPGPVRAVGDAGFVPFDGGSWVMVVGTPERAVRDVDDCVTLFSPVLAWTTPGVGAYARVGYGLALAQPHGADPPFVPWPGDVLRATGGVGARWSSSFGVYDGGSFERAVVYYRPGPPWPSVGHAEGGSPVSLRADIAAVCGFLLRDLPASSPLRVGGALPGIAVLYGFGAV